MRNLPVRVIVGAALVLTALTVSRTGSFALADTEWKPAVEALTSPAGANSREPQMTVQGDRTILSWIESAGAASHAEARRAHGDWVVRSANRRVRHQLVRQLRGCAVRARACRRNARRPLASAGARQPRRIQRPPGVLEGWTHVVAADEPHHDGTETEHGFVSLFQAPGAGLGVVWLDGRGTNPEAPEGSPEAGNMALRATVYGPDGKQRGETVIAPRVCECCSTSTALTSEGVIVAFRNRSDKEVRDIYVSRLADGKWSTPTPVHNDGWKIDACPINGPAVSARNRDVAVAWFTVQQGQERSFAAFSKDAGRTFGSPIRVDEAGSLGRVNSQLLDGWVGGRVLGRIRQSAVPVQGAPGPAGRNPFNVDNHRRNHRRPDERRAAARPRPGRAAVRVGRNREGHVARANGEGLVAPRIPGRGR